MLKSRIFSPLLKNSGKTPWTRPHTSQSRRPLAALVTVFAMRALSGCTTFSATSPTNSTPQQDPANETPQSQGSWETRISQLEKKLLAIEAEQTKSSAIAGKLEFRLQAQSAEIFELKKSQLMKEKFQRTGISLDLPPTKSTPHHLAPDKALGDEQQTGEVGEQNQKVAEDFSQTLAQKPLPQAQESAHALLELAKGKIHLGQYGDGIVILSDLHAKYPNTEDSGESLLLLAQSWLQLHEPQNVLPVVKQLYMRFPNSPFLMRAKLLEALAQEKIGAKQTSGAIFREILSLRPSSLEAQEARGHLARLRLLD